MPCIEYVSRNFSASSVKIIEQANEIIAEYQADGFDLTLRQLYYHFVSRDILPNTKKSYSRLGSIINDARLAGLIDWNAIEDRTRNLQSLSHWESPAEIMHAIAEQYSIDRWENQLFRVEVWIEKEALVGVISQVCRDNDDSYFACRGYVSQSEMWSAAQRLKVYEASRQKSVIIHLGDHDPSGIDMTRDIQDRLNIFGTDTIVERIALNMAQVNQYQPPPNPAKMTDSRFAGYVDEYGDESWELDALDPHTIVDLIQQQFLKYRNAAKWRTKTVEQKTARAQIKRIAERWDEVVDFIG